MRPVPAGPHRVGGSIEPEYRESSLTSTPGPPSIFSTPPVENLGAVNGCGGRSARVQQLTAGPWGCGTRDRVGAGRLLVRERVSMPSTLVKSPREPWLLKAIVQGVAFSLIVALASTVFGPPLAAQFAEAVREPSCADPRGLTRVSPTRVQASSELSPETTSDGRRLTYEAARAIDGDTGTAWVEGVDGLGQGNGSSSSSKSRRKYGCSVS